MRTAVLLTTFYSVFFASYWLPPLSRFKPWSEVHLGLHWNWVWPAGCCLATLVYRRFSHTPIRISCNRLRGTLGWFVVGGTGGFALQAIWIALHWRHAFHFQGVDGETFLFQTTVSFAEEALWRGAFQSHLQNALEERHMPQARAAIVAVVYCSLLFGLSHGLNPILRGTGGFDAYWFLSMFCLSSVAGAVFVRARCLMAPVGVHLSYNYIASFF